jgi:hypothetical protein
MKTILYTVAVLAFAIFFNSCKEDDTPTTDNNTFLEHLESAPYEDISKESLPKWLVIMINNNIEKRPSSIGAVKIYKGEWNKQTVYFIMDTFSSCICDFYTETGERIMDSISELYEECKNWILVYKHGEF